MSFSVAGLILKNKFIVALLLANICIYTTLDFGHIVLLGVENEFYKWCCIRCRIYFRGDSSGSGYEGDISLWYLLENQFFIVINDEFNLTSRTVHLLSYLA